MAKETATQRKRRLEKARKKYHAKRINETEEVRRNRLKKRRLESAKETPEQRKARIESQYIRQMQVRATETEEKVALRREKDRLRHMHVRGTETIVQKENRLEKQLKRYKQAIAAETSKEREIRQEVHCLRMSELRAKETLSKRALRLELDRTQHFWKRAEETFHQYNCRLEEDRLRHRKLREEETAEMHEARVEEDRLRHRKLREEETADIYDARIEEDRLRHRKQRENETAEMHEARVEEDRLRHRKLREEETADIYEARIEEDRLRHRKLREEETAEMHQTRVEEDRLRHRKLREEETAEMHQTRVEEDRLRHRKLRENETAEMYQIRVEEDRLRHRKLREEETAEMHQTRVEENRLRHRKLREEETAEMRQTRVEEDRLRHRKLREKETAEMHQTRVEEDRLRHRKLRENETAEMHEARVEDDRLRHRKLREEETAEMHEARLEEDRLRHRKFREEETTEMHEARLEEDRLRHIHLRNEESQEQHNIRLEQRRQLYFHQQQELLSELDIHLNTFQKAINNFSSKICEICSKLCYPGQISSVRYHETASSYLPTELLKKSTLLLCSRCRTHVTSRRTAGPSKGYWNNLKPGDIPVEIAELTQPEQRLLSRIIPFVKVVKLSGLFGQYGFRGQAVLFAQDIFEVSEKLPKMLPRSTQDTGIVVVTETLENLNISREFCISRTRVYAALNWLVQNNPLYKDVLINEGARLEKEDFVRVALDATETAQEEESGMAYMPISASSRILRASWHQGDTEIFNSDFAGTQCCAMALANIVRAAVLDPQQWSTNILNMNMIEGDTMYQTIRSSASNNEIDPTGYLEIRNFNSIKENFKMYSEFFSLDYDEDTAFFGSLQDKMNKDIGMCLRKALEELFRNHSAGILIASSKSLGVMHYGEKYYFTDSHSCGPKGATAINGRACIIQCDTIEELHRICKRATSSRNTQFVLHYINVSRHQSTAKGPVIEQEANFKNIGMQTSVMAPIDCAQPDVEEELEINEDPNKIKRKTKDNVVNEAHELKAEEFAWFYLFPYGINGLKEDRPVRITPLDYYQYRILGSDDRFQRNDYLFYALSMYEYYRVKNTISACGRRIKGQDGSKVEDLHLYMKNLRGSAAYWRTALNDLIAQIRCLGPPTYFVTFSCNDLHWMDMRKALLVAAGRESDDPEHLDINATQRLIEKFPVIVSRHFMIRVNALMKFLKNTDQVFGGKIEDYWWRIEFQNRGSPHLHMVVWIEGHPAIDTPEGLQQIDKVCLCNIPQENSDIFDLVKKCQIHHHTSTCQKRDPSSSTCRFNFPRQVCKETHIVEPSTEEFIKNGGRICLLRRRYEDRWVNSYNPILLKLWKGNMDIQPCGSNESIAFYIAKYISKSEPVDVDDGIRRAIRQIQREDTDISRRLFKICMRLMKERQVSACECIYRLCHLPMRESSRKTVFLNTRKPEQRYSVLKFNEDGQAAGCYGNIFERYENRPKTHTDFDFDHMTLVEFSMQFEPYYAKKVEESEENVDEDAYEEARPIRRKFISLENKTKMLIRNTAAVIRVPHFIAERDPENYFYSLLLQYLPYRKESEILEGFNTAREAFLAREEYLKEKSSNMKIFCQRDKQLENAFNKVQAFQILEEAEPQELSDEEEEAPHQEWNEDQFESAQRAMNIGQRDLFVTITKSIRDQLAGATERLRIFITGGAGVGKTFVLNLLRQQINRCYGRDAVKVCALTGVAARLINGSTIHSTLKLPVQKDGRITGMSPLTGNYLRIMRQQWKDKEFMVIDEISMVSYQMLCMIDSRLRQLKNQEEEFFGGMNVLLFGDLMQLPPIKRSGTPVFKQPQHLAPATHLWRLFSLCELKENMRQQGDRTFIDILNALRVGEMRAEHFAILTDRILKTPSGEFALEKALRIYPTNRQVADHNEAVLQLFKEQGIRTYIVRAQDNLVDATRNLGNVKIEDIIPSDANKTGGLPKKLEIFVGAKVMLRSNVDVAKGLVNGAIGFISEIIWPHFRRTQLYEEDIPSVRIDFGRDGVHLIQPITIQFPAKFSFGTAERRMLPLVLSWASTVHKMQGCTVENAVVYLGSKLFEEGQAYVALSRVRSLDGLRIEELDCLKLSGKTPCNNEALAEMERMREGSEVEQRIRMNKNEDEEMNSTKSD